MAPTLVLESMSLLAPTPAPSKIFRLLVLRHWLGLRQKWSGSGSSSSKSSPWGSIPIPAATPAQSKTSRLRLRIPGSHGFHHKQPTPACHVIGTLVMVVCIALVMAYLSCKSSGYANFNWGICSQDISRTADLRSLVPQRSSK